MDARNGSCLGPSTRAIPPPTNIETSSRSAEPLGPRDHEPQSSVPEFPERVPSSIRHLTRRTESTNALARYSPAHSGRVAATACSATQTGRRKPEDGKCGPGSADGSLEVADRGGEVGDVVEGFAGDLVGDEAGVFRGVGEDDDAGVVVGHGEAAVVLGLLQLAHVLALQDERAGVG